MHNTSWVAIEEGEIKSPAKGKWFDKPLLCVLHLSVSWLCVDLVAEYLISSLQVRYYNTTILFVLFNFSHQSRDRLADLVAEHLDHLHYLNDILCLGIEALNEVLTDHLLNRLLIPLYVYSLTKRKKYTRVLVSYSNRNISSDSFIELQHLSVD